MNPLSMTPDQRIAYNAACDIFYRFRNETDALKELDFRRRRTLGIDWDYAEYCLHTLLLRDEMRRNRRRML